MHPPCLYQRMEMYWKMTVVVYGILFYTWNSRRWIQCFYCYFGDERSVLQHVQRQSTNNYQVHQNDKHLQIDAVGCVLSPDIDGFPPSPPPKPSDVVLAFEM